MKVVIDTNVVVSAILRDRKPEEVILVVQQHPQFEWIASVEILAEYVNVIQRKKFNLPESIIARWILAVGADFLITGDGDFEAAHRIGNTEVLSVALFKSLICDAGL